MKLDALNTYLSDLLEIPALDKIDSAVNGIQVTRRNQDVGRVAVAVDACMETLRRAAEWNADMLFVHHGIYWGHERGLRDALYERVRFLIEHDICLYAVHLPLDRHPELGNNICIARELALTQIEPFGRYRGEEIGYRGRLASPQTLDDVGRRLTGSSSDVLSKLPFGPDPIQTVGIISGGATNELNQAIEIGLDLYITGDAAHLMYHQALEAGINVLSGGHYQTETWGVRAIGAHLATQFGIETDFIDLPTGL